MLEAPTIEPARERVTSWGFNLPASGVVCLAFVPATNFLASGDIDGSIHLFDLSARNLSHSFTGGHSECVRSLLTVPGTTLLLSYSDDKSLKVWNVVTHECLRTLAGHTRALANVPGNLVALGGKRGSIAVWNPATGDCQLTFTVLRYEEVRCFAWIPGLDLLAVGGSGGSIMLVDIATGEVKATVTHGHTKLVSGFEMRVGVGGLAVIGTTLLASCGNDRIARVWEVTTGQWCKPLQDTEIMSKASQWTLLLIPSCRSARTRPSRYGLTSRPPAPVAATAFSLASRA